MKKSVCVILLVVLLFSISSSLAEPINYTNFNQVCGILYTVEKVEITGEEEYQCKSAADPTPFDCKTISMSYCRKITVISPETISFSGAKFNFKSGQTMIVAAIDSTEIDAMIRFVEELEKNTTTCIYHTLDNVVFQPSTDYRTGELKCLITIGNDQVYVLRDDFITFMKEKLNFMKTVFE